MTVPGSASSTSREAGDRLPRWPLLQSQRSGVVALRRPSAIAIANTTDFGLSSAAWTTDPAEQEKFSAELEAGGVFLNGMTISYPELPFGGIKNSGYGRELGEPGIKEFCNMKTVWKA